jgi:amino-acid N-acetyltransferase
MSIEIEFAVPSDLPAVLTLLRESGLPKAGLAEHPGTLLLVARGNDRVVGTAALELYGKNALLRSVAVEKDVRGEGLGDRLTRAALDTARRLGVTSVYLLTETAEGFFEHHGFARADRNEVPDDVARSVQFTYDGCGGATSMVKCMDNAGKRRPDRASSGPPAVSLRDLAPASDYWAPRAVEEQCEATCGCAE